MWAGLELSGSTPKVVRGVGGTVHNPKDMEMQFVFDLKMGSWLPRHGGRGADYLWAQFLTMKFGSGFRNSMYNQAQGTRKIFPAKKQHYLHSYADPYCTGILDGLRAGPLW